MDFAYFATPQAQAFPYMGGLSYTQPHDDPNKLTVSDSLDPSYLPTGYDAFRYNHFQATSPGSPTHNTQPHLTSVSSADSGIDVMEEVRRSSLTRASSEEKENTLTPAQSRRKAQNRAAQRAFRERKERHVRDLEAKLSALESSTQNLQSDNERLKIALQRVTTENKMLRGVSSSSRPSSLHLSTSSQKSPSTSDSDIDPASVLGLGGRGQLLDAGAAWDLIQSHQLVKQGLVDIADVCERLKAVARCDGQGPVYEESMVWRAVEESNRGGGDELI